MQSNTLQERRHQDPQRRPTPGHSGNDPRAHVFPVAPLVSSRISLQAIHDLPNLHRGCVTPEVLHNWATNCEGNMDLVDGYDDLPADLQAKVKRALEQKHVDDEDWNGVSDRAL